MGSRKALILKNEFPVVEQAGCSLNLALLSTQAEYYTPFSLQPMHIATPGCRRVSTRVLTSSRRCPMGSDLCASERVGRVRF